MSLDRIWRFFMHLQWWNLYWWFRANFQIRNHGTLQSRESIQKLQSFWQLAQVSWVLLSDCILRAYLGQRLDCVLSFEGPKSAAHNRLRSLKNQLISRLSQRKRVMLKQRRKCNRQVVGLWCDRCIVLHDDRRGSCWALLAQALHDGGLSVDWWL